MRLYSREINSKTKMKKVFLFALSSAFAALGFAQTERIYHESLGGKRYNFKTTGLGNFGQVPLTKIAVDSVLIDSIMKDIEKKRMEDAQKHQKPAPKSNPTKRKPAPSKQSNKPAAISNTEQRRK